MLLRFLILLSIILLGTVYAAEPTTQDSTTVKSLYKQGRELEIAKKIPQALELYKQAVTRSRNDSPEEAASILYVMGDLYKNQHQFGEAETAYQESLTIREQILGKEHNAVAVTLNGLAGLYYTLGDYSRAEPLYQRALAIDEKNSGAEHAKVAVRLNNLAELYRTLGEYSRAEPLYKRALAIDEKVSGADHPNVAIRLSNLAEMYRLQGDYAQVESLLKRALAIDEKAVKAAETDPANLGIRLNNLGQFYRTLGDYARAEPFYKQALAIWEKTPGAQHPMTAAGLNNLGWIYFNTGNYAQAESLYKRALAITEKVYGTKHPDIARNLNNLALLYATQGKYSAAEPLYQRALEIWQTVYRADHPTVAITLTNMAKIYRDTNDYARAEPLLQRALVIAQSSGQPELLWLVQDNLSQLYSKQGEVNAAILIGKEAVNTLQQLRTNIAKLDKELQRVFIYDKAKVYKRLATLLTNQGRLSEAQQILLMLKEEEYFDFIRRDEKVNKSRMVTASFNELEQVWSKRIAEMNQQLASLGQSVKTLVQKANPTATDQIRQQQLHDDIDKSTKSHAIYWKDLKTAFQQQQEVQTIERVINSDDQQLVTLGREYQTLRQKPTLTPTEESRKEELRQKMVAATQAFNVCLAEFKTKNTFQDKNLDTLKALQGTLRELAHGAVLVHYLVMDDKLRIILTTPQVQLCREAKVTETMLNDKIAEFREIFKNPPDARRRIYATNLQTLLQQAQGLYQLLFAPIAKDLEQAQAKTLMLSLDGVLRYLPIAALHDGTSYIAEKYALVMFTEAARDKLKDKPTPQWRVAGLGLTEAFPGFNPLPSVVKELDGIIRQNDQDTNGVISGTIRLNKEFTAASFLKVLDEGYPVLHIASHFVFQPSTDQDSYLLLGDGDKLSLAKIRVGYDFNRLDLLTLSACQTAVGSTGRGQEVEGFGALAQKQGAKSVLATLWPVDDQSTGAFMQHVYQIHAAQPETTKVSALQQVQTAFILAGKSTQPNTTTNYPSYYEHPYYWAPFILMGNWL